MEFFLELPITTVARIIMNSNNIVAKILDDSPMQNRDCYVKRNRLMHIRQLNIVCNKIVEKIKYYWHKFQIFCFHIWQKLFYTIDCQ